MFTDYHAKYFANELLKRCSSDSFEKLTATLIDAQVVLTPHQVEAALFAFRSPLSKGAILADEVGLGKTIEAGIVLSQKWAERKRKILIIVPSSLRKQWNLELLDKFFLPSQIIEAKPFNKLIKEGSINPFSQEEIIICSYHFAKSKANYIKSIKWDLVVIDEAHRLRNVYKTQNKIARVLKDALYDFPKILLTATPLQNTLMELYGLVSFIDDYAFGDIKSFKSKFSRLTTEDSFLELKNRLAPLCKRTLRRQVLEYIKYTNRISITEEFIPSDDEQTLYELVSDYLRKENLQALPKSQRSLMTLVLRKLLASSTFAIAGALDSLTRKLKVRLKDDKENKENFFDKLSEEFETLDEMADEWDQEDEIEQLTKAYITAIENEIAELEAFSYLAVKITNNTKGESLLKALEAGFEKIKSLGGQKKAIIFTESRKTQEYLVNLLTEKSKFNDIVLFNGSNSDKKSKEVYIAWLNKNKGTDRCTGSRTADIRTALVDYFKDKADIMIATEAAAEGINLQFCSLVVNFDLPWNPQRIEQRIGRCHRYGQKCDVVVINFLNKKNEADQRVYKLLDEKFKLFDGVFGASDEVLGVIESGVDFEKRIAAIYQNCRSTEEIDSSFDELQNELSESIDENIKVTRKKLLENFDEEVSEKLKMSLKDSKTYLNKYETFLWGITEHFLAPYADFHSSLKLRFTLKENPFRVYLDPEFKSLWDKIKQKTTYSVEYSTEELIKKALKNINEMEKINPPGVLISKVSIDIEKSGIETKQLKVGEMFVGQSEFMPDILTYLQRETELTRKTLVEILKRSERLEDFLINPQRFMHTVSVQVKRALNEQIANGIKYEKIEGKYYEMRLFEDNEISGYLNSLIESQKSVYDNILFDSPLEKRFAEVFEQREDIKLFVKLPGWFKIDTPVGTYNPDWAYVKKDERNLYLVAETKGTKDEEQLRGLESKKIKCGKKHFEVLDGVKYRIVTSPDEI